MALLAVQPQFYTSPREFFERYAVLFCTMPRKEWHVPPIDRLSLGQAEKIRAVLIAIPERIWTLGSLSEAMKGLTSYFSGTGTGNGEGKSGQGSLLNQSFHYMRWALTGGRPGPSLIDTMVLMGRDVTLQRFESAEEEFEALVQSSQACTPN